MTLTESPNHYANTEPGKSVFQQPAKGHRAIGRTKKDNASPRKLRRWGHNSTRDARPTMFYPIFVKDGIVSRVGAIPDKSYHPPSKNVLNDNGEVAVWPIDQNGIERRWNFGLDKVGDELGRITAIEASGEIDLFLTSEDTTTKTVWTEPDMEAGRHGASLVRAITGVDFPFPKSIYNVMKCLGLVTGNRNDAIILDFFAGSGTTGHATLLLNREDEGKRQFILVTNNENRIAEEVTYPRIKNVIEGYGEEAGIPANVRYLKTDFVPKSEVSDDTRRNLVRSSTDMICVRENTFTKKYDNKQYKIYSNGQIATGILFDLDSIEDFKARLNAMKLHPHIYVFSLSQDTFAEDFADLAMPHKLCPIPESILEVYRKLFS